MKLAWPAGVVLTSLLLVALTSCRHTTQQQPTQLPTPDITPTRIDYVDSDGFDALLENSLIHQDPAIIIHTGRSKPDWGGRLNAWIAAWNRGGHSPRRAESTSSSGNVARGQSPLAGVHVDGATVREFRLLVTELLDRIETLAQNSGGWWAEERARSRRVSLLRPYSLRFHLDDNQQILLVFFHGNYSSYYPRFLELLTHTPSSGSEDWSRALECSWSRSSSVDPQIGQQSQR